MYVVCITIVCCVDKTLQVVYLYPMSIGRMTNPPARNGGAIETFSQDSQDSASLASISMVTGINLQTLLMEAFGSIGEPDSVYGCGAGRLVDTNARWDISIVGMLRFIR